MNIFVSFFSFFSFGKEAKNGGITAVVRGVNVWGIVFGSLLGSISLATMLPQSRAPKSIKKERRTHLKRKHIYDVCSQKRESATLGYMTSAPPPPLYEAASHHIFYVLAQHEWAEMQKLPHSTAAEF